MAEITNPTSIVRMQQLAYFKAKLDSLFQTKNLSSAIEGLTATTVEGAIAELLTKALGTEINFEKLQTPNTGKAATYRFTKGTGASQVTMDIDIEKDKMNATIGFVTIREEGGKYYDGSTEVTAADGVTGAGVYLKSQELADGTATGVNKYVSAEAVIEYITLGDQTGKVVTLALDPATHKLTADIGDGAVTMAKLAQNVQDILNSVADKAEKVSGATNGNFAGLDANGNLTDSGKKPTDFKEVQSPVTDPAANGEAYEFISGVSQDAQGVITPAKKVIPDAAPYVDAQNEGKKGLMSAADKAKLDAIAYAANSDIDEIFA